MGLGIIEGRYKQQNPYLHHFFMNDLFFWACIGTLGGVVAFIWGFIQLKKKHMIENIPTSKIRSMAIGLVEIKGKSMDWMPLQAPFSQEQCVYFQYEVEELRRSKNRTYWASIHKGNSNHAPFYLEDETARVIVNPKGAEVDIPNSFTLKTGFLKDVPGHIVSFLDARGVRYKSFFGTHKTLRFTESHIGIHHVVYVLGVCKNNRTNLAKKHRRRVQEIIRKAKANPKVMAQFDTDGDGQIDAQEWELARQLINKKIHEKHAVSEEDKVYIGEGEHRNQMFYISNKSEKQLVRELGTEAMLGVFGGALLSVASVGYVISVLT